MKQTEIANQTEQAQILILQDIRGADPGQKEIAIQSIQTKRILGIDQNLELETEVNLEADQKLTILTDLQDQDHALDRPVIHIPTKNLADTTQGTKTTEIEQNPTKQKETENPHKITITTRYPEFVHHYLRIKAQLE